MATSYSEKWWNCQITDFKTTIIVIFWNCLIFYQQLKTWVLRKLGNFRKILKLHIAYCLVFHKNENFVNTSTKLIKIELPVKINQNLYWTFTAVRYFTCNINFFLSSLFTIASEKRFFLITYPRPFEVRML